jgi:hypothetical protein
MTEEQEKRFKECIKTLPPRGHKTPESADKSALEAVKTKKIKEFDREDASLQSIAKELHGIYKELSNLNRILSRRK